MNEKMNHEEKALILVEEIGGFFEKSGYIPSAARVYALLMVWSKDELHFDEIQEILNLSKGGTSKALSSLLFLGRIEKFTKPKIRKKFYRVKPEPGKENARNFSLYLQTMRDYLQKIDSLKDGHEVAGKRHKEEIDFFDRLISLILKEFEVEWKMK